MLAAHLWHYCGMYKMHILYLYGSEVRSRQGRSQHRQARSFLVEGEGVLNDPLGLTVEDESSAGESRWITVGMNAGGEVLVVVWTERDDGERLISVRRATAKERKDYEG
jgi:uncharacterized protein